MHPFIMDRISDIEQICRAHHVRRLELFGSATGEGFDLANSDVDLIVEFELIHGRELTRAYFGLIDSLESLFGRHVDIVTLSSVRNPYFRKRLEETRQLLYAA